MSDSALAVRQENGLAARVSDTVEVKAYLKANGYIVNLGGKDYVLTTGLVDAFHRIGGDELYSEDPVMFRCLEFGCDGAKATDVGFRVRSHAKIGTKHFSQIGDACPHNTTSVTAKARQRMAETRANGRTLRLATNAGYTTTEEVEGSPRQADVTVEPATYQAPPTPTATETTATEEWVTVRKNDYPDIKGKNADIIPLGFRWKRDPSNPDQPMFQKRVGKGSGTAPEAPPANETAASSGLTGEDLFFAVMERFAKADSLQALAAAKPTKTEVGLMKQSQVVRLQAIYIEREAELGGPA